MSRNAVARPPFANLARAMRSHTALKLSRCRLSAPIQPPWGQAYRMVEWSLKSDPHLQRCIVPADCTPSDIADALNSHVPGRRYGPREDED
ncbi:MULTISPECIES: DUF2866 domain-containing protein [unclassified Caballeronia]|uniref:DUF2866 domain-containing protein n=1 Tax=unclassified Caballeronia TaxID=2646786 RepID=UPI0028617A31|nr:MULTISPECIES: DUF2866 domain-containing protein [unclassified Caballeronia]MDR5739139.1 DUF2866 domain-containing protein [Caballeronia sp. LZ016]MDR5807627.1 DUF2866 domain-containing protein [Caballeronia sp. LZ019]